MNTSIIKIYLVRCISAFLFGGMLLIPSACKKFVQAPPPNTELIAQTVFENNATAAAAVTYIYEGMTGNFDTYQGFNGALGLSADEFKNYSNNNILLEQFYTNALNNLSNNSFWGSLYKYIYDANAVLEGLDGSSGVTTKMKQQLEGEAAFVRAFSHFYLVNLYGDVPLVTTTNYLTNNIAYRTPASAIYKQIIADLQDALRLLSSDYVDPTGATTSERIRPNKEAATALLARVYLYTGVYDSARDAASKVINETSAFSLVGLDSVFLTTSREAIWQLQAIQPNMDTYAGAQFILTTSAGNTFPLALNTALVNTFEPNDSRYVHWVNTFTAPGGQVYYYPYKYKVGRNKPVSEYLTVLRLAEQYLIRAEAEVKLGDTASAKQDLNAIRHRAGLLNTTAATTQDLLKAIQHERQVELFTEFGDRWLDLKRTGAIDSVMGPPGNVCKNKGGTWNPDWALYPIIQGEITINPNLTQNPGY